MMKIKRRTSITTETHEIVTVRINSNRLTPALCPVCRANVRHYSLARAARALQLSETDIFRLAENRRIHSTETPTGQLLICRDSLANLANEMNIQDLKGAE